MLAAARPDGVAMCAPDRTSFDMGLRDSFDPFTAVNPLAKYSGAATAVLPCASCHGVCARTAREVPEERAELSHVQSIIALTKCNLTCIFCTCTAWQRTRGCLTREIVPCAVLLRRGQ